MLWLTLRQLKSKRAPARRRAAEALCRSLEARAFDALAAALATDADDEVRRLAATALGKLEVDDERRVEALLNGLRDQHAEVQKAALAGLKNSPDPRVVPVLIPLLRHTDPGVRGHAATLLNSRGWKPEEQTDQIHFHISRGQLGKAAAHGSAAVQALETVIQTGAYHQRIAAVEALGMIDDKRVIKPLLGALRSQDSAVCAAAVRSLGERGDAQNFDAMVSLLRHSDGHVRTVTTEALARLGTTRAVEPLKAMLRDRLWDVRHAAANSLGKLKDPRAVEVLTGALNDDDADVREAVAIALGRLNDRRAIGPLVKALTDAASGVRRCAAAALTRIDEDWSTSKEAQGVVEELKAALQDKDQETRYVISSLLNSLGIHSPETNVQLSKDAPTAPAEQRRKLAASLFLANLYDADNILRQAAAEALGRLGEQHAEPALQDTLRDPDPGVRLAAERALDALQQTQKAT